MARSWRRFAKTWVKRPCSFLGRNLLFCYFIIFEFIELEKWDIIIIIIVKILCSLISKNCYTYYRLIGLIFISKYRNTFIGIYSGVKKNWLELYKLPYHHVESWKFARGYRFQTSETCHLKHRTSNFELQIDRETTDFELRIIRTRTLPLSQAKWLSFPEQFHIPIDPKSPSLSLRYLSEICIKPIVRCNQNHLLLPPSSSKTLLKIHNYSKRNSSISRLMEIN